MAIRAAPLAIGRAFAAPPATPADRVRLLRDAFAKAVKDADFVAESKKAKIEVGYIDRRKKCSRCSTPCSSSPPTFKRRW